MAKGAICKNLKNEVGFGTTELHVLRPNKETSTKYLWYVLRSNPFKKMAEASMRGVAGQQRVPSEFVENFRVPILSLDQQNKSPHFSTTVLVS